jgi:hypothetical protein
MPCSSDPPWLDYSHYIWRRIVRPIIIDIIINFLILKQLWYSEIVNFCLNIRPNYEIDSYWHTLHKWWLYNTLQGFFISSPSTGQEQGYVTVRTRCSKTCFFCKQNANRKSSARTPIGHRLDDLRTGVRLRAEARDFLFSSTPRPSLEPMKTPIQWVTRALSLGVNPIGLEANHSPASSVKVKNTWSYTSVPQATLLGAVLD